MLALPRPWTAIANSMALPAGLLLVGVVLVGLQLNLPDMTGRSAAMAGPAIVTLAPADFIYRPSGSFVREANAIDAPLLKTRLPAPLTIMQFQVSDADYARCVTQGACAPAAPQNVGQGDIPVTGVNYEDAIRYAAWLSRQTGQTWTLPTDREWAFAAGANRPDEALGVDDSANPALRWLADYELEAKRKTASSRMPLPLGSFGTNEHGVADIAGNVWEWTQTCHRRVQIDAAGIILTETPACSIRVLDGQHRAPMSVFVRDAKSGGCLVGTPPANFGFRLVRRPSWTEQLRTMLHI